MTVTLDLPPDLEAQLQAEATKQLIPVEDYLVRLVAASFASNETIDRRTRALELLRQMRDMGDAEEQQETFAYLKTAVEEDRLSERKRF